MSIVTYLEMHSPSQIRAKLCDDERFAVRECTVKQWRFNRFLYFTIGENWQWTDKSGSSDEHWHDYAESHYSRTFAAYYDGSPAGCFELHHRNSEIAYFGLTPAFYGRGFGGALLTHSLKFAWQMNPTRVWVHTCAEAHQHHSKTTKREVSRFTKP